MRKITIAIAFAALVACAKKTLPEGNVRGISKFQLGGGAAISQPGVDEYNPYVLQTGDNFLVLVFGSNRSCGTCTGHNLFIARSTTAYNNDAVFPAFESPAVVTVTGTPLNYTNPIAFAPTLTGNNVRIFLTNAGGTVQQTAAIPPGGSSDTTLTNIANTAGLNSTVVGVEFTGTKLYTRQNGTLYSFNHASAADPLVAMATGQTAASLASIDGAFTSRYDGFFSLIDGTIAGMSLYGMGGNVEKVNTAIAKARLSARFMSVMRGGGFNGGLMFISGIESGGTTQDLYVVDGLTVWQMWYNLNPKPPEAPGGGSTPVETTVANPAFSPVAGSYGTPINVTMTSTTTGAVICYTTDGVTDPVCNATPACTTGTTYVSAVNVTYTTTNFRARACKAGLTDSAVVSAQHISDATQPSTPTAPSATANGASQVDLGWTASTDNTTAQAQITYEICQTTINNGCNTFTATFTTSAAATSYNSTGLAAATTYYYRIRSRDLAGNTSGYTAQLTATTAAAPTVNAPTFSPVAGTYNATQNVTISSTTPSATICYTTDGNTPACDATPTCTTGSTYSGTVAISATAQLRAIGCRNGYTSSSVTSGTYTIDTTPPVISATAPATGSSPTNTQVSYTVSEACASGSITWTRTGGTADAGSPHVRSLVGSELTSGAHNNITLTNNPTLVSGAVYSVSFNCTDAAGNAATTVTNTNVTHSAPTGPVRLMEPNSTVNAMVLDGNNLYIGGDFTYVGVPTGSGAMINTSNGAISSAVTTILNMGTEILTAAPDGSGGWYIGGTFTTIGGVSRNRLARINADGTLNAWNPNANSQVSTLVVNGGIVYAGGSFTVIDGQTRNRIAALDATTGTATAWNPNGNFPVNTLTLSGSGTTLYVGGQFTTIGGQTRNRIAEINISDALATAWSPNANSTVSAIAVSGATVYVGGSFSNIGGQARNAIAAILASDGSATSWSPGAVGGGVNTIAVSGTTIYVGGGFIFAGGLARNRIAALDAASNTAMAWNPNANNGVSTLVVSGSVVYAGGDFTSIGGQTRNRIAAIDTSTGSSTTWNPSPAGNRVNTISISGSVMFAGGDYTHISGQTRNRIAAIDVTTGGVTTWNPNASSGGAVINALAVSGSTVYAGGSFSTIGGQTRNSIAALDATTGNASAWNPNSAGNINAIVVSGTNIYVGGTFATIGGQSRSRIAALDSTTGLATSWNPGANSGVLALAVSGSTVFAAGNFDVLGGSTRWYVGGVDAGTGLATAWNPTANNPARALYVSGSTLYVGGGFTNIAGNSRVGGAAFDIGTGTINSWWPATLGGFATIYSISVSGSTVYVGGSFTNAGGTGRNNVAALNDTTATALSWNPNANQLLNTVVSSASAIYVGGQFTTIGSATRNYLAVIDPATGVAY